MKKYKKTVKIVLTSLFAVGVLSLTGCAITGDDSEQADTAIPYEISEAELKSTETQTDVEVCTSMDTAQTQDDTQIQSEKPSADLQGWTQEKIDEADRRDRALREEKIKAAGGISEDEAIEIATKAMEADIGYEKAKELEVCIWPDLASNGWKLHLWDITDSDEYKGEIAYFVNFGNKEEVVDPKDFCNYTCVVNAVDGSICGAYSLSGDVDLYLDIDDFVWYEH